MDTIVIVFDTSFLINAIKAKVDPLHEIKMRIGLYEAIIPTAVMDELNRLKKSNINANVVLELLKKRPHIIVPSGEVADDAVVHIAAERKAKVASTDKDVRRRAKALELDLVTLRDGRHIWIDGMI
ncbi:MAG: hypothetical protein GOU98_01785 [Candidatus Altiarchaeota archaeon]|nr:hypothetical protein [Candidatus Altiarchaeota archaeon]